MSLVWRTQTVTVGVTQEQPPMEMPRPTPALHVMDATAYAIVLSILEGVLVLAWQYTDDWPKAG